MCWLQLLVVVCAVLVACTTADAPAAAGYGPPPAPSYHPAPEPVYPAPVSYAAIPVYEEHGGGKKGGLGKFFSGIRDGLSIFGGGKGKRKVKHVHIPECHPVTSYVTQYVTEVHPVPVVETEIVNNVVPTVVYQTKFERQLDTSYITNVETDSVTVTSTKSIVVPRVKYVTQTETELRTNNVFQSTTEVSFTPFLRTVYLTETRTVTKVARVPDVRVTTVDRTRILPPSQYLTVTEPQLITSLVHLTETVHVTLRETESVTERTTHYEPPLVHTTTVYSHVTRSVYGPAPQPVTITQQVREYVPTLTTQNHYVTTTLYSHITQTQRQTEYVTDVRYVTQTRYKEATQVVTDYVTVHPQCDLFVSNQNPSQLYPGVVQQRQDTGVALQPIIQHGGGTGVSLPTEEQQFRSTTVGVPLPTPQPYVSPTPQIFSSG